MKKINYGLIPVCLMMFFAALLIQPKKASAEEICFIPTHMTIGELKENPLMHIQ